MRPNALLLSAFFGCGTAQWTDTFTGQDMRSVADGGVDEAGADSGGSTSACAGLASSKPAVGTITVTFPNYGTPTSTIHVATGTATCDVNVDTSSDGVLFASDALPCAPLLAPGKPGMASAIATAVDPNGGPTDLQFQWSYSTTCVIVDDYALSRK